MSQKLVSVIIPAYNAEKTVELCLESVLTQSYKNIEIIIVNDGSKDNSLEIYKKYEKKEKRIKLIDQKNGGVSNARNNGIKKALGEYILFLDADDYFEEQYIEVLVGLIEENNDSLPMCRRRSFTDNSNLEPIVSLNLEVKEIDNKEIYKLYNTGMMNPPFCKLFKTSIIKKNNILFDESISLGEDLIFNLEYIKYVNKIVVSENELYNYRVGNQNSLSRKYYKNMLEIQDKLYKKFDATFNNIDSHTRRKMIIDFYMSSVSNEFHNKENNFIKNYKNARRIIKKDVIQKNVKKYKKEIGALFYFLISNGLVLTYIFFKKLSKGR